MSEAAAIEIGGHADEPHQEGFNDRLNWLRAGVLGANDGIVSVAGIVLGVAGATSDRTAILVAGVAGLVAGAMSMAAGEYVSVSTQRDSEEALLAKERRELLEDPEDELAELAGLYADKGLDADARPGGRPPADREGRPRRACRGRARHRSRRPDQRVERRVGLDAVVHDRCAAAAADHPAGHARPAGLGHGRRGEWRRSVLTGLASARFGYGSARRAILRNVGGGLARDGRDPPGRPGVGTQI